MIRSHRRKVVISTNAAWNIANFRSGLVKGLISEGYSVVAAAPPDGHIERVKALGCQYVPIPMDTNGTSAVKDFGLFVRYVNLLRREQPGLFLGYTVKPNIYGSLAAHVLRIPVVNTVEGLGTSLIGKSWITPLVMRLYRAAFSHSYRVVFQNQDDLMLFVQRRLVPSRRTMLVAGCGVDLTRFNENAFDHPPKGEKVTFLLMARLMRDKGILEFVEAARLIRQRTANARFQLLGFLNVQNPTAISRSKLETWVAEGVVEYLGEADDVRPFIAAADCVVLPSYREGAPRALLEAAAMSKPLITTDVPGCKEVVQHMVNGFLCNIRDSISVAQRMLDFIALSPDERHRFGVAGRAKMEREFDERTVVRQYLETFESIFAETSVSNVKKSLPQMPNNYRPET
jgi:glycosyltransferase involved in cell wall biosynthesis